MEWIIANYEMMVAGIALLFTSGIVIAVKNAIKETKEAYKKGESIIEKIKVYKKDGYSPKEIKDLMNDFEDFYKEGKEAYEAIDDVIKLFKKSFKRKSK